MTPETTAKAALKDALAAAYTAAAGTVGEVAVSYGPPPADTIVPCHVWLGGIDADEQTGSLRGARGPGIDESFRVTTVFDATVPDPSPDGAEAVSDLAYTLLKVARDTVRAQLTQGPDIAIDGDTRSILRWSRIVSHASDGPLPIEGANGWVETVTAEVEFVTRIRGV